jgi:TM2 domain-containing membrane protein YozV
VSNFDGTVYFLTLGLLGVGWLIDLFLIPSLDRQADLRFKAGRVDYTIAWILLTFFGFFGVHRMYMGKWLSGIVYLLTGGLSLVGILYVIWTLNDQITLVNQQK